MTRKDKQEQRSNR